MKVLWKIVGAAVPLAAAERPGQVVYSASFTGEAWPSQSWANPDNEARFYRSMAAMPTTAMFAVFGSLGPFTAELDRADIPCSGGRQDETWPALVDISTRMEMLLHATTSLNHWAASATILSNEELRSVRLTARCTAGQNHQTVKANRWHLPWQDYSRWITA